MLASYFCVHGYASSLAPATCCPPPPFVFLTGAGVRSCVVVIINRYVVGGFNEWNQIEKSVEVLDLETCEWATLPTQPKVGRVGAGVAAHCGNLYVVGGENAELLRLVDR